MSHGPTDPGSGAAQGAAAGTAIFPGIGTIIGAILGGFLGARAKSSAKRRLAKFRQSTTPEAFDTFLKQFFPDLVSGGSFETGQRAAFSNRISKNESGTIARLMNLLAKSGLLESGFDQGTNTAVRLATGAQRNESELGLQGLLAQGRQQVFPDFISSAARRAGIDQPAFPTTTGGILGGTAAGLGAFGDLLKRTPGTENDPTQPPPSPLIGVFGDTTETARNTTAIEPFPRFLDA